MHILLVVHEATLTGAPRVALLVAAALRDSGRHITILLRWPGPLVTEFHRLPGVSSWNHFVT